MNKDDEFLISRCKAGDENGFKAIFDKYSDRVFTIALRFCCNEADAEDIAQEVFVRFFKNIIGFRGEAKIFTWLYRITINLCINHRRALSHKQYSIDDQDIMDDRLPPKSCDCGAEIETRIQQTLAKMREEERNILILKLIKNLSYADIAEIMEINEDQVRGRIYRAKQRFREIYIDNP